MIIGSGARNLPLEESVRKKLTAAQMAAAKARSQQKRQWGEEVFPASHREEILWSLRAGCSVGQACKNVGITPHRLYAEAARNEIFGADLAWVLALTCPNKARNGCTRSPSKGHCATCRATVVEQRRAREKDR